ncbi:PepSY domain-containing protein [Enterococcus gilvus]|uniref:PepSY domain-containing protein n=1 Tax=Enterococcus gilvus TaxID=160453 RepID=UPI00345E0E30
MTKKLMLSVFLTMVVGLAGCSAQPSETSEPTTASQETKQTKDHQSNSEASGDPNVKVSVEEAIGAYQETYPDSDITSIELDTSFGKYLYKIEGVGDKKEYELHVDAETKKVSKEHEETLDRDEQEGVKRNEDKIDVTNLLSIKKVSEIAADHVGKGKAAEWTLEQELGTTYWEVKVVDGQTETEVKVDAHSGKILETESGN